MSPGVRRRLRRLRRRLRRRVRARLDRVTPRRLVLGGLVVLVLGVVVLGVQAVLATTALLDARAQATTLQVQLAAGQVPDAEVTLLRLRSATGRARLATSGPLWALASHLPVLGGDAGAARTVADVLDGLAQDALPTTLRMAREVQDGTFRPRGGRVDLDAARRLAPLVRGAARSVDRGDQRLSALAGRGLTWPLTGVVASLRSRVHGARQAADATAAAITLGPSLLGEHGTRRYLLLVQNNAEIRSTGGLPGAFAILTARHGVLRMGWQGASSDLGFFARPVLPLTAAERGTLGSSLGTDVRDVTVDPDFPRAARLAAAMVERRRGVHLDGVLSVDPVALARVLAGTGPLPLGNGTELGVGNVLPLLLHQTYQALADPAAQDSFDALVARTVFTGVTTGQGNPGAVLHGLATAVAEHRVLAWFRDPRAARAIAGTAVSGALPGRTGRTPQVGVYLDDAGGGKMEYYLRFHTHVSATGCRPDGSQSLVTSTALTSTAPHDVSGLSPYVTGDGSFVRRGTMLLNLRLVAPAGGAVTGLTVDGQPATVTADRLGGRQVSTVVVRLWPGRRVVVASTQRTGAWQTGDAVVSSTPGVEATAVGGPVRSACG
jgi:hypothetical protein